MSTRTSISRRDFLQAAAGTPVLAVAAGRTRMRGQSANSRVRVALIGGGGRGNGVAAAFAREVDCQVVAAAEVFRSRLDATVERLTKAQEGVKVDGYEDYRRILERQDVDAVLIATPDHWHCPMTIDACAAGKDVYVEKPLSNEIGPGWKAVEAARRHDRIVQMGVQQRSGDVFKEAAEIVRSGQLGAVTHVLLQFPGNYGVPPEPSAPPPPGLNWELFQGPAPRRPFRPGRLRWRNFYDYGGGLVSDWGVHLVDVAHWYLNAEREAPLRTGAAAQYVTLNNPERDQCPDAFSITWQYERFVMSFTNAVVHDAEFARHGTCFFGPRGSLLVHRGGFEVSPGRAAGGGGTPSALEPVQPRRRPVENQQGDPSTAAHVREFLDSVKSRKRPSADIEIGYYSTLPTLLALHAIREGRTFKYDHGAHQAVAV